MIGYVNSIQSLGTVDGPGVRYTVFMQGCNLRCHCCHNPETHSFSGGREETAEGILKKVLRFKEYFGSEGGITLTGGEPLMQTEFAEELFRLCKENGINTCLDTSGSVFNCKVEALLKVTDRVLLDIKYTNNDDYLKYVGCTLDAVTEFLKKLDEKGIPTTIRQVVIPGINDTNENYIALEQIIKKHSNIDRVEMLGFKKLCQVKYDNLGISFPFSHVPEPSHSLIEQLNQRFSKLISK